MVAILIFLFISLVSNEIVGTSGEKFFPKKQIESQSSQIDREPEFLIPDIPGAPSRRSNDILQTSYNLTAKIGQNALLPCSVRNIGSYKILWLRVTDGDVLAYDNMLITQDSRFQLIQNAASESNLFIKGVRLGDAGEYACQLNTKASKTKFLNLVVQSNFAIPTYIPSKKIIYWVWVLGGTPRPKHKINLGLDSEFNSILILHFILKIKKNLKFLTPINF